MRLLFKGGFYSRQLYGKRYALLHTAETWGAYTGRGANNKFTIEQACFCPIYRPQGP